MKLEKGKQYKTRSGLITDPLKIVDNGTSYRFESELKEPEYKTPSVRTWLVSGRFLTSDTNHKLDLIEEA